MVDNQGVFEGKGHSITRLNEPCNLWVDLARIFEYKAVPI